MVGRYSNLSVYREIFRSRDFLRVSVGTVFIPVSMIVGRMTGGISGISFKDISNALLIISIAINGLPIIKDAVFGILKKKINVDELVSIAIIACLINGFFLEGAIVSAIMIIGALIEEAVSDSARKAIEKLITMTPETAIVEVKGIELSIKADQLRAGDIVLVKSGEMIPADGVVIFGQTAVDESSLTGESIPVSRKVSDSVSAGTMNIHGFIKIKVTNTGKNSTLGKIITMIEAAESGKIESSRIVDKYASWFTPVILTIAGLTYILTKDISRATTVLIVGCPCSFLLSGPVTTVAAIARAARSGILVKGGKYLEHIAVADAFFFDKTGTLTEGVPKVILVESYESYSEKDILSFASAVEKGSCHPLAGAIINKSNELQYNVETASDITTLPGEGICGIITDKKIFVGVGSDQNKDGYTSVEIRVDDKIAGRIFLLDTARKAAQSTLAEIKTLGIENLTIISGDQEYAVKKIAQELGASNYHFRLKPEDKLNMVKKYSGKSLIYLGDGINDAPALKEADTGIVMGLRGSDVALETADIVLLNDRIDKIPFLIRLSRKMVKTIKVNIFISFTLNIAALTAAFLGVLSPIWGAVFHNLGSILVVFLSASLALIKEDR